MEIEQTFWMCSIFGSFSQKCEIKTLPWKGIPYYNTFIFQNIAITLENGRVARVPGPVDRRAGSSSYNGDEGKLPGTSMWLTWTLYITSNIYCSLGVSLASTNIDKFRFIWVLIYYRENFRKIKWIDILSYLNCACGCRWLGGLRPSVLNWDSSVQFFVNILWFCLKFNSFYFFKLLNLEKACDCIRRYF